MSDSKSLGGVGFGLDQQSLQEQDDTTLKRYSIEQAFDKIGGFSKNLIHFNRFSNKTSICKHSIDSRLWSKWSYFSISIISRADAGIPLL